MASDSRRTVLRVVIGAGGALIFVASLCYFAFQYFIGFSAAPGPDVARLPAVATDIALFTVFAMHHSVFARAGLKQWIARAVSPELERSVYVWVASLLFIVVCALWQPVSGVLWHTDGALGWLLLGVQIGGGIFTLIAARSLDVLHLSGARQALGLAASRPATLDDRGPYGLVRHPIYFAWLLLVWPAPLMNGTRLAFAAISTAYLIAAIPFEERDLHRVFGDAYGRYSAKVRYKLIPGVY